MVAPWRAAVKPHELAVGRGSTSTFPRHQHSRYGSFLFMITPLIIPCTARCARVDDAGADPSFHILPNFELLHLADRRLVVRTSTRNSSVCAELCNQTPTASSHAGVGKAPVPRRPVALQRECRRLLGVFIVVSRLRSSAVELDDEVRSLAELLR